MHHSHTQQGVVNESIYVAYDWQIPPNVLEVTGVSGNCYTRTSVLL